MIDMKKAEYCSAIALILVEILFASALIHNVFVAKQAALAYSHSTIVDYAAAANATGALSYNSPIVSLQSSYSVDNGYLVERWGIRKIQAPEAWQITRGDPSILIAVLDTGISKSNPVLADKVALEVNLGTSPTCDDLYGHGTHMAGTIVAVAPECRLMNVKVADDSGKCTPSVVAKGIIWAVEHGARIINLSLVTPACRELEEAVNYAWNRGVILVAAAGNKGKSDPSYPAYYVNCLAVAGVKEDNSLALLSSHGDWVDVCAPGFNIYSELPDNQYGYKTGTSAAAAHVSGVAALVLSVAEDTNGNGAINDEVRCAIENSCTPIGEADLGQGLINAFQAVLKASSFDVSSQ